jgi:hypothetical protein
MELSQPETQSRAFKPAPQQLADVPIMRGWNGNRNGKSWETVETGRKLVAVKAWLAKDALPKNWREQLDDQFVTAITRVFCEVPCTSSIARTPSAFFI